MSLSGLSSVVPTDLALGLPVQGSWRMAPSPVLLAPSHLQPLQPHGTCPPLRGLGSLWEGLLPLFSLNTSTCPGLGLFWASAQHRGSWKPRWPGQKSPASLPSLILPSLTPWIFPKWIRSQQPSGVTQRPGLERCLEPPTLP